MAVNTLASKAPLPSRVYITHSVLEMIKNEAQRQSSRGYFENETGGILVGRRLEGQNHLLIVAATGPGENAYHHPVEFNPDVEYVNRKLQEICAEFPKMDYIGTWHKHPPQYQMFSTGDVHTAHATFRDPSYKMDEIVNPIVWLNNDAMTIRYYYMHRSMVASGEPFRQLRDEAICEIADNDPLVNNERATSNISPVSGRINDEHRRLRDRGYEVEIKQQGQDYYFVVTSARLPDTRIYLIVPATYPIVFPSLIVEHGGIEIEANDGGVLNKWTMNRGNNYLVDIVEGVASRMQASLLIPTLPSPADISDSSYGRTERPRYKVITVLLFWASAGLLVVLLAFVAWQRLVKPPPTIEDSIRQPSTLVLEAQQTAAAQIARAGSVTPNQNQQPTLQTVQQTANVQHNPTTTAASGVGQNTPQSQTVQAPDQSPPVVVLTSSATTTPLATPALITPMVSSPISLTYQVDIRSISLDEFREFGQVDNPSINAYVDAPSALKMSVIGDRRFPFVSDNRWVILGVGSIEITVDNDASGQPVKTVGNNRADIQQDSYYLVTVKEVG